MKKNLLGILCILIFAVLVGYSMFQGDTPAQCTKTICYQQSPEQRLESLGYCDVVYYEPAETWKSRHLGATPIIGIGVIWYQDAPVMSVYKADPALVEWFGEVIGVACAEDTEWRLIEVDVLYERGANLKLAGTIVICRRSPCNSERTLYDIVAEGGLTPETFQEMVECGQVQVMVNSHDWKYLRGFNRDCVQGHE